MYLIVTSLLSHSLTHSLCFLTMSFLEPESEEKKRWYQRMDVDSFCLVSSLVLGVVVGLSVPGNEDLSAAYRPVSSVIGWTYVIAWTIR